MEAYIGKSGREMVTPPVHEITKDKDAAGQDISAMEDQNHGFMTYHEQKTMVNYRTRKEGEIAPRDTLYPTMLVYKKAAKGAVMIKPNSRGRYDAMEGVQNWAKRADWPTKKVNHTYRNE